MLLFFYKILLIMNHVNIYLFTHWNALSEFEFFHTKLLVDMFSPTILMMIRYTYRGEMYFWCLIVHTTIINHVPIKVLKIVLFALLRSGLAHNAGPMYIRGLVEVSVHTVLLSCPKQTVLLFSLFAYLSGNCNIVCTFLAARDAHVTGDNRHVPHSRNLAR